MNDWLKYNPPNLLVGPVPHKRTPSGAWVPDYDRLGVTERVKVEIDMIEDMRRTR